MQLKDRRRARLPLLPSYNGRTRDSREDDAMSDGLTRREMTKACALGVASLALAETATLVNITDVAAAATTKPRKVTNVKVSRITATSAKVTWQKVPKAYCYEIRLSGNGKSYKQEYVSHKRSYNLDYLNPEKKCTIQVRAVKRTKNGQEVYGKWSDKKTFKTKSALVSSYKLSGTLGTEVTYKLTKVEIRKEYQTLDYYTFAIFFTATNNKESDISISGPNLNAYQNGVKLNSAYSALGLDDDDNGLWETIAPGYSINGWIGFQLRDKRTPVVLKHTHYDSDTNKNIIDFERTVKLV